MPNTRKKIIKTVYKDEDDSEAEIAAGDFSDSGSDAKISEQSSSGDDDMPSDASSGHEFHHQKKKRFSNPIRRRKKFAKEFIDKIHKQTCPDSDSEQVDVAPVLFSVKDLTDADKLLPSVLNLSDSDSSEDDAPKLPTKKNRVPAASSEQKKDSESDGETTMEYKDVWSKNLQQDSEQIAVKTFMELEQHKAKIEETKASISNYSPKICSEGVSDVKDLLAQGEEVLPQSTLTKKKMRAKKACDNSDSEMEDWEEVKEAKALPQQGLQVVIALPDAVCRKRKSIDIEMMMKRKINRVKKEQQVYMHKVHVLCWIAHGNYVSRVLNDQDVLAAALSLVPSKECFPGKRVDMKYVEQIATWYKDKLTLKQDKNEDKYRPKALPLKEILLAQTKSRVVTSKKYLPFIFVSMLRALGLQSRIMFNFVALPIKPPSSELCSLSTKTTDDKATSNKEKQDDKIKPKSKNRSGTTKSKSKEKISQVDGQGEVTFCSDIEFENIWQLDGNNDVVTVKSRSTRTTRARKTNSNDVANENEDVSPPKRARTSPNLKQAKQIENCNKEVPVEPQKRHRSSRKTPDTSKGGEWKQDDKSSNGNQKQPLPPDSGREKISNKKTSTKEEEISKKPATQPRSQRKRSSDSNNSTVNSAKTKFQKNTTDCNSDDQNKLDLPIIVVTNIEGESSKYFGSDNTSATKTLSLRRRAHTVKPSTSQNTDNKDDKQQVKITQSRTRSAPGNKSKYFNDTVDGKKKNTTGIKEQPKRTSRQTKREEELEDNYRVSHKDVLAKSKTKAKNDVTADLIGIIKNRVKEVKAESKKGIVKGKVKIESDEDSDFLPEEVPKRRNSESDDDFKPMKISPKPSTSRKIDRRVLSSDDDTPKNKVDVWCEVFVEELEQWVAVDVINGKAHCANEIYSRATHPVCYAVGWDNNNYLKDVTRRYVPHWNTVTRKQRAEPAWWAAAAQPWRGPLSAGDREEDEQLNRMQLEAPLPKSIAEYKNHPLYALKRHLLKFEALYPPDAATLGFVRGEPVYARECVHVCRSRDTWLKEAKVVRLGESPYKVVKARPKWDKLSNKLITDKPLEVFGPWQVQEYEPPVAEGGVVPRNAYGNVELFKECMLPKGTVHIKLPGLNRVAKKLNIDCAPAMTGFDFNGGWSHPVYDGFVVCEEFGELITDAWVKDQEEQERKEREKIDTRVYGNWRRLIKGLFIRERLKIKYGFEEPKTSHDTKKSKAPRLVVKKKS